MDFHPPRRDPIVLVIENEEIEDEDDKDGGTELPQLVRDNGPQLLQSHREFHSEHRP
jgi:hypothetical protein